MQKKDDIFNGSGKISCDVPEGYFDELKSRLEAIPSKSGMTPGLTVRMRPYLALAACFVAIMIAGNVVLRSTAGDVAGSDNYSEMAYAALSQAIQVEEYLPSDTIAARDTISNEDVVNYLIDSGASAELIEYTGLLAQK